MVTYNASCAQVAAAFAEISKEVNELGASLRNAGRADLFEAVRSLQLHEKEQLRLVRARSRPPRRAPRRARAEPRDVRRRPRFRFCARSTQHRSGAGSVPIQRAVPLA